MTEHHPRHFECKWDKCPQGFSTKTRRTRHEQNCSDNPGGRQCSQCHIRVPRGATHFVVSLPFFPLFFIALAELHRFSPECVIRVDVGTRVYISLFFGSGELCRKLMKEHIRVSHAEYREDTSCELCDVTYKLGATRLVVWL